MSDNQILFNRAYHALKKQGKISRNPDHPMRRYLAHDGCKCGVGHLIDPEHYDPSLEGYSADTPLIMGAVQSSNPDLTLDAKLLMSIQYAHDRLEPDNFQQDLDRSFGKIAAKFGLEMPV